MSHYFTFSLLISILVRSTCLPITISIFHSPTCTWSTFSRDLGRNLFSGSIPPGFRNLTKLMYLYASWLSALSAFFFSFPGCKLIFVDRKFGVQIFFPYRLRKLCVWLTVDEHAIDYYYVHRDISLQRSSAGSAQGGLVGTIPTWLPQLMPNLKVLYVTLFSSPFSPTCLNCMLLRKYTYSLHDTATCRPCIARLSVVHANIFFFFLPHFFFFLAFCKRNHHYPLLLFFLSLSLICLYCLNWMLVANVKVTDLVAKFRDCSWRKTCSTSISMKIVFQK